MVGSACGSGTGVSVIGDGAGGSTGGGQGGTDSSGGGAGTNVTTVTTVTTGGGAGGGAGSGMGGFGGAGDPCLNYRGPGCNSCRILDEGTTRLPDGGLPDCRTLCGVNSYACTFIENPGQPLALNCQLSCLTGRRPAGLEATPSIDALSLGAYFSEIAFLEAASVDAFHVLADELRHHGAPPSLVRAAERAGRDEVRHARMTRALARRYGSNPARPRVAKRAVRPLEATALENATEGCVRETFGALLATFQAHASKDPVVRAAFERIARDETRHAALAWRVAAWIEQRLDSHASARVREARRRASDELVAMPPFDPDRELSDVAGLPSAAVAAEMAREMNATLWAA